MLGVKLIIICLNLGKLTPLIKCEVTSLGVVLDLHLSFQSQINRLMKT